MCMVTLCILTYGNEDMEKVPHIEGSVEKCMIDVDPMVLREDDVEIIDIPPAPLEDGLNDSTTLYKTLSLDIM
jgi:hypothetical protein